MLETVVCDVLDEMDRAESIHGRFPNIIQAAAVTRREEQEAWAETWKKPVNRTAAYMEYKHLAASAMRLMLLLKEDPSLPLPGPFASRGDDMTSPTIPGEQG
jgi:hypothetical protein